MALSEKLYEAALAASRPLIRAGARVHRETGRAVRGRDRSLREFQRWSFEQRDRSRPTVWFHAPSVGEALMAQAIIRALRERRPDVQVVFTHFSPSAERMAERVGGDAWGYIPWDTRGPVRRMLEAVQPQVIAFVRTEVWPVVTREARRAGARQVLVNAVLSEESGRLSRLGRRFLGTVYRRLDGVGAVTSSQAERYQLLGVPPGAIRVTGDARFDQALDRIEAGGVRAVREGSAGIESLEDPDLRAVFRALHDPAVHTLVAGSTWPSDEKVLAPVVAVLRREGRVRLVIAPHEPTASHLESLERRLDDQGVRHSRLGALVASGAAAAAQVVIVDRMGILAELYALASSAYVGGGFRSAGLHSVVEPAALGVPTMFGPGHGNAREAAELAAAGGGFVVDGPGDVEALVRRFTADPEALAAAGGAARSYVLSEAGAAGRNAEMIEALMGGTIGSGAGS